MIQYRKINFKDLEVCKDLVSLDLTSNYIATFIDNILADNFPLLIFTFIVFVFLLFIGFKYALFF